MKNKIPSEGLRLGRDSGSILCDTLKKVAFSDSLGGGTCYGIASSATYNIIYSAFRRCQSVAPAEGFVRFRPPDADVLAHCQ